MFKRLISSRIAKAILAVVWTLVLLEGAVALFMFVPAAYGLLPVPVQTGLTQLHGDRVAHHISMLPECAQYDPETFYTLKSGATCRYANHEYDTAYSINSAGLRDTEADLKAPEVIVLGDSFAMGAGVEADETFVAGVERLTGLRILNAGISSFGTERELRLLRRLDTSKVKVVIVQYSDNDFGENLSAAGPGGLNIRSAAEYRRISAKHLRKTRYIPFKLSFYLIRDVLIKGHLRNLNRDGDGAARHDQEVAAFLGIFRRMREIAPGARFVVTELSGRGHARGFFLNAVKDALAGDANVAVVPVEAGLPESAYFSLDIHLNRDGHRRVAEALAPHVGATDGN